MNTAAMHHVENCEQEPQKAFAVNGLGARNLALVVRDIGATLMHVSTDYVFDGAKASPYEESDAPNPLNVYGTTKLCGEYFVRSTLEKHFVLRTSAIYGRKPCRAKGGLNFIELMLKLAKERGEVRVVDSEISHSDLDVGTWPADRCAQSLRFLRVVPCHGRGQCLMA